MDEHLAIAALSALAQPTRLRVFRLLVERHPVELQAGDIAGQCDIPHNTLSVHLAILVRARLATVTRRGRTMNYAANIAGFRETIGFLTQDCCGGRPEICGLPTPDGKTPECRQDTGNHETDRPSLASPRASS